MTYSQTIVLKISIMLFMIGKCLEIQGLIVITVKMLVL